MEKMYISGPMTGFPECNYPAFFEAEDMLVKAGYAVENPARNPEPSPKTWEGFMRLAIAQVCKCTSVVLLPGWENSRGAKIEVEIARTLGMKVITIAEIKREWNSL